MTYDELTEKLENYKHDANLVACKRFAMAHKWEFVEVADFLDVHTEDKLWYPVVGSGLSVLFEVKDVSTEAKFNEPFMKFELYEAYSDTTFYAQLLYHKGKKVNALKFKDPKGTICWVLLAEANITKEPCHPGIDDCDLLDQIGKSWFFTLHSDRIVDIFDEIGKDGKDLIQEHKYHRLAYKDVYENVLYSLCDDEQRGDMVCASADSFKDKIAEMAKEKKKVKVTIGGVEYVFANAEEARAILGTPVNG